jgi:3-phenylpropionate/cinnamic acid dioxygenase small subunit
MTPERENNVPPKRTYDQLSKVTAFYGYEALLLDEMRFAEWSSLLTDDVVYEMPVRCVLQGGKGEFATGAYRIADRLPHIKTRIDRLATGHAWAEEPPSRVVRCVGSITSTGVSDRGGLLVESAVVLYRQRGQNPAADVMAYRRSDELLLQENEFRIARRRIVAPDSVLKLSGITLFL